MTEPLDLDAIERAAAELNVDSGLLVGDGLSFLRSSQLSLAAHIDDTIGWQVELIAEVRRLRNVEHRLSAKLADEKDTLEQLAVHHGWDVTGWRHFREALRQGAIAGLEV